MGGFRDDRRRPAVTRSAYGLLTAVDRPAGGRGGGCTGARRLPQLPFHPVKMTFVTQAHDHGIDTETENAMRGSGAPGARLETQTG